MAPRVLAASPRKGTKSAVGSTSVADHPGAYTGRTLRRLPPSSHHRAPEKCRICGRRRRERKVGRLTDARHPAPLGCGILPSRNVDAGEAAVGHFTIQAAWERHNFGPRRGIRRGVAERSTQPRDEQRRRSRAVPGRIVGQIQVQTALGIQGDDNTQSHGGLIADGQSGWRRWRPAWKRQWRTCWPAGRCRARELL